VTLFQLQEFRTGATRNNMESVHFKEESKKLRDQLQSLRDKLADSDNKVRNNSFNEYHHCGDRIRIITAKFLLLFLLHGQFVWVHEALQSLAQHYGTRCQ